MEIGDIHLYKQRWRAVEDINQQEVLLATPAQNWRKLNILRARAIALGLEPGVDEGELEVYYRWAKLKEILVISGIS